jgi:hypothetical protein
MLTWAHKHGVKLRLIEPGKPNHHLRHSGASLSHIRRNG